MIIQCTCTTVVKINVGLCMLLKWNLLTYFMTIASAHGCLLPSKKVIISLYT